MRKILSRYARAWLNKKVFKEERGALLPFALLMLMVGVLVVIPFLSLGSTALRSSEIYEDRLLQVYAADAGVEWAMWHIASRTTLVPIGGEVVLTEFESNGLSVNVTISDLGDRQYRITSTSGNAGSATVIGADVSVDAMPDGYTLIEGDHMFTAGFTSEDDYYVTGDVVLSGGCTMGGDIYAGGNIIVTGGANVLEGHVVAEGDILFQGGTEVQGSVGAGGNLTMQSDACVHGDAYVGGDLDMSGKSEIMGDVYIGGDIGCSGQSDIGGSYPLPYEGCPFAFNGITAVSSWDIQYN